jgi:hypothetical protein
LPLDEYIDKLVAKNEPSNLLFISLVASKNKTILEKLIAQDAISTQI